VKTEEEAGGRCQQDEAIRATARRDRVEGGVVGCSDSAREALSAPRRDHAAVLERECEQEESVQG